MESDSIEDENNQTSLEKVYACLFFPHEHYISPRVQMNPMSNNTKLFSMLALLNAYVPKSYLTMEECRQILGPPDPIYGGPPFKVRMKPFSKLIRDSGQKVRLIDQDIATISVELLAGLNVPRSSIARDCVILLCGEQAQPHTLQSVKDLLTMREMGQRGKEKFSLLIKDIINQEKFGQAVSVLTQASNKFIDKHIYPQTLARLYYIGAKFPNFKKAEKWAKEAIETAQNNSYAADTLGQVYKNRLLRERQSNKVKKVAEEAFEAFRNVEMKAEKELDPEWREYDGSVNFSVSFNNRGHFGFIQVAKIVSEKLKSLNPFKKTLKTHVEAKCEFFEWYLSYSKPDRITVEPDYFWKDVASCYKQYTGEDAADSTSFPALLDWLNHCMFVSKERRAFKCGVTEKTQADLEQIRDELKAVLEENVDDVKVAERYILSNIILSNKVPHSPPQPALVRELQSVLQRFLPTGGDNRNPEFYLLVLLLFWPEKQFQTCHRSDSEEQQEPNTDKDQLQDQPLRKSNINEEDSGKETEQSSPDFKHNPDLEQCVTSMEKAYDKVYTKYLRGRYLVPLFFLGKGVGLSRWIHRSRLDAEVECKVETELGDDPNRNKEKRRKINDMWRSGSVWQLPEIQNMLQSIQIDTKQQSGEEISVFVDVGDNRIAARAECESGISAKSPGLFYLGFNIRGPVVFEVRAPSNILDCQ